MTDELWKRTENKTCWQKPGAGRKPMPPRRVLEAISCVLRTGALPKEYRAVSSVHQYFRGRRRLVFSE
ncbi:MAG: hypothetical protein LBP81_06940 [Treponema sp.]|nr:hypothetical protein [Treponema sp.]